MMSAEAELKELKERQLEPEEMDWEPTFTQKLLTGGQISIPNFHEDMNKQI